MNEKKLVMYMHAGSGNHGCEAIVNSVCHMIKEPVTLVSYQGGEDGKYSLKNLCEIRSERRFEEHRAAHVLYYLYRKLTGDGESLIRYRYGDIFKKKEAGLAVSIGGDNYCYDSMIHDLRLANRAFCQKEVKTVLLGCSIEPELLQRKEIAEDLMHYHTIIARESITFAALQKAAAVWEKKPDLFCFPDPAFTLGKKELPLPEGFLPGNTVGINVSPMIQEKESSTGITMENYGALLAYIIEHTDMQIALIPHVVWEKNDDRKPLHDLYEQFRGTGRVLEIQDGTCEELKGFISRCRFFIAARTHASIAAYSSLVPTLVAGYSVKARGIARDLFGTEENFVLPVQSLKEPEDLVKGFVWLFDHEEEIKESLEKVMPSYREKALQTGKEVDRLWEEFGQQPRI
jgi:polysaccharide pyruvyl transferase WcaK-like protein